MTASISTIPVGNGLERFHCPVCGTALIVPEEGFQETACSHMAFFVDWVREVWFPSGAADHGEQRVALQEAWEADRDVERLAAVLPETVSIFVFVEPARGGGHDGSEIAFGIDFAARD